jgi:hypothetical protein
MEIPNHNHQDGSAMRRKNHNNQRTAQPSFSRRDLLRLAAVASLGAGGLSGYLARALAAARVPLHPGVREIQGEVRINNQPARLGQLVQPGDVIVTGKNARAVIIIGQDAYLLRGNTRFEIDGQPERRDASGAVQEAVVEVLRVIGGAALSVFGSGRKRIETPFVTIGIRGTGVYVESGPERSYVCTCYGETELIAQNDSAVRETVKTQHHEAPRYISGGRAPRIEKAPVRNHTDAELDMLEALVGRQTPFEPDGSGYY